MSASGQLVDPQLFISVQLQLVPVQPWTAEDLAGQRLKAGDVEVGRRVLTVGTGGLSNEVYSYIS